MLNIVIKTEAAECHITLQRCALSVEIVLHAQSLVWPWL